MSLVPPFAIGAAIDNQTLTQTFKVGNMGGMRRSTAFNCLVVIADHIKKRYDDKWFGDVLHYAGMGKHGDQVLTKQNKLLAESATNGIELHLFESFARKEYIYFGLAKLCAAPYQLRQKDREGNWRLVWIFPLQTLQQPFYPPFIDYERCCRGQEQEMRQLPPAELASKAVDHATKQPAYRSFISEKYLPDAYIATYAKLRARGFCQLCGAPAPFSDAAGNPYLETHHILPLHKGGYDAIDNVVALCPNCHKKMHLFNAPAALQKLRAVAREV